MANSFLWLKENPTFSSSMKKMSLNIELDEKEVEFMLSCAILFFKEYSGDNRKSPYFQIGYYIVLKCAINNNIYEPLLDTSSNFGLYPISKYIIDNILNEDENTNLFPLIYQLEKYKHNDIIETYEQSKYREQIIKSNQIDNCYVAPTSFGKSSLIVEIIKEKSEKKVSIIVPTKSLLIQTYKLIKENFPNEHIIFHDDMYDGEDEFISIFTQERALRLLKNESLSFDLLIIDEAHNIFEMGGRSLLLTRLIRRNRQRNPSSKNYYLSPLISNTGNLKVTNNQEFFERRILNNIKEADISEYRTDNKSYKYNRFLNEFYPENKNDNFIDYIINKSMKKNFIYLRAPRKVEDFSELLNKNLTKTYNKELQDLSDVVSKNIHSEFYCVEYIKQGLIYLHGKLPDLIKEYLEHKFSSSKEIKYIVANSVILEGVNLPIDNLYIMNTNSLDAKSLTNLIGRVNRLNEVFDPRHKSLKKLTPSVHFVNSEFNRVNGKMSNKIQLLKNGTFTDVIKNPLLKNFSFDNILKDLTNARAKNDLAKINNIETKITRMEALIERENFIIENDGDSSTKVKRLLLESALSTTYYDTERILNFLEDRARSITNVIEWNKATVIDKVYLFFIDGLEHEISNPEFLRLKHPKARSFYKSFVENLHRLNLKDHILETVKYFLSIKNTDTGNIFFIGDSYGEIDRNGLDGNNTYINLSIKSYKELVNIALVKIKMETDFVSYKLNEYINILFELNLISDEDYELHIYGTTKKSNSDFVKIGLSGALINKLDRDQQIKNLRINEFGIIEFNPLFRNYLEKQDDLTKFEIRKYIDI